jgi:alpha-mannosidase
MYLLIEEDDQCAERTPPWGEPTIEGYIERIEDNLDALERLEHLAMGYEWSAAELEMLAEASPGTIERFRELAARRRAGFCNGTYSQPHLQVLGAEANIRQFELGRQSFGELGLPLPVTYMHQESSLHEQLPQLLAAFGYRHAVLPGFTTQIEFLDPRQWCYVNTTGFRVLDGDAFVHWEGLDGTRLPFYIGKRESQDAAWRTREQTVGLLHSPSLITGCPDLQKMDEEWLELRSGEDYVLIDAALDERLAQAPPQGRARVWSGWSYLEGIGAEELCRSDRGLIDQLLALEGVQSLAKALIGAEPASLQSAWKTVLRYEHHDAYCFCSPGLKERGIAELGRVGVDVATEQRRVIELLSQRVSTDAGANTPLLVVNPTAHRARVVLEVPPGAQPTEEPAEEVLDWRGNPVPTQSAETGTRFLADLPGLGYQVFFARPRRQGDPAEPVHGAVELGNDFYRAIVEPDGTLSSLRLASSGAELLDGTIGGNVLSGTDSTEFAKRDETVDIDTPRSWSPPGRGPARAFVPAETSLVRSSLGQSLRVLGEMGPGIAATLRLDCYHALARIDVTWTFEFSQASVGTFYDDESKLVAHWAHGFDGVASLDIPFGVVTTPPERPFYPTAWVDWSDGRRGLAHLHAGTPKHWITGTVLKRLIAWGEETDAIGSRDNLTRWLKSFDQRLRGTHVIRSAVLPHEGSWREGGVAAAARSFRALPVVQRVGRHDGDLAATASALQLADSATESTSVRCAGETLVVRVHDQLGHGGEVTLRTALGGAPKLRSLAGDPINRLAPWQIGEVTVDLAGYPRPM